MERNKVYSEVRIDYFDHDANFWCVDAWKSDNDDEEGKCVGIIHPSGDYYIFDHKAMFCENVIDAVNEKVKEIKANAVKISATPETLPYGLTISASQYPKVVMAKKEELMSQGLSEEDADNVVSNLYFDVELFYSKGNGIFAVESEAVESGEVYDPYTQIKLVDEE